MRIQMSEDALDVGGDRSQLRLLGQTVADAPAPARTAGGGRGTVRADAGVASTVDGGASRCRRFTTPTDPGPGGILFAASGEVLALDGVPVPACQRR